MVGAENIHCIAGHIDHGSPESPSVQLTGDDDDVWHHCPFQATFVQNGFTAQREFLVKASKAKQPSSQVKPHAFVLRHNNKKRLKM